MGVQSPPAASSAQGGLLSLSARSAGRTQPAAPHSYGWRAASLARLPQSAQSCSPTAQKAKQHYQLTRMEHSSPGTVAGTQLAMLSHSDPAPTSTTYPPFCAPWPGSAAVSLLPVLVSEWPRALCLPCSLQCSWFQGAGAGLCTAGRLTAPSESPLVEDALRGSPALRWDRKHLSLPACVHRHRAFLQARLHFNCGCITKRGRGW